MASKKRGMRRELTAYGEEEFSLFPRKAFIEALVRIAEQACSVPMYSCRSILLSPPTSRPNRTR